jgi:hypothetical protein
MRIAPSVENATQPATRVQPAEKPEAPQEEPHRNESPSQGYISPVINVDTQSGVAVLQFRDDQSGEVTAQFPSETVVRRYREGEVIAHGGAQAAKSGPEAGVTPPAPAAEAPSGGGEPAGGQTAVTPSASGSDTAKS